MEKVVAFDTETKGLDWFDPTQGAFLATWADHAGEYKADLTRSDETNQFLDALSNADVIVAHNLSFDVHMVRETTGFDVLDCDAVLHDTDLMSRVLFPEGQRKGTRGGHGLKHLAEVWLRADAKHGEEEIERMAESMGIKLKSTGGFYDVWRAYPDAMEYYALLDARYTRDLYLKFREKLVAPLAEVYALEMLVAPILIRAEQKGTSVDQNVVARLKSDYSLRRTELVWRLEKELGEDALSGAGSEEALLEALQKIGVPLHRKTDSGKIATNQFALQEFEDDYPVLSDFLELRRVEKFLSTYIEPMVGRDAVHPSFRQCGAWTGRMSCMRPNMQNIPKRAGKEVRAVFVPRAGCSFVVVDYESIEVRLLAWYLGDAGFRQLIEDGHDPHAWMASHIYGGSIEDYHKGTEGEDQRAVAKNTLFAIVYGAGAPRVSDMNKITKDQAKSLISKIKSSLPRYHKLNKRIRGKVEAVGHVNTLIGRKQVVKQEKAYVGLNAIIQGSAADIMKAGLVAVDTAVQDLGATVLLVVHDEVVVEVPTENADECLRRTEEALVGAYDLSPSLAVSGSVVHTNYADA